MAGALSMASVTILVATPQGRIISRQSEAAADEFVSIGYGHLRQLRVFRTPSLGRTLHSSGAQLRPCVEARALSPAQEWVGLPQWRTKPVNDLRVWGKEDCPTSAKNNWEDIASVATQEPEARDMFQLHWEKLQCMEKKIDELKFDGPGASLTEWGAIVLATPDPVEKAVLTHHAYRLWCNGELPLGVAETPDSPARPAKPELVHPKKIPPPADTILTPSAHAIHNLAHIELNAIDLAWDTLVRFSSASGELDPQFFADFAHVADDESRHCLWCLQRLAEMGFSYGDMPAHNLLLVDCQKTSGSVMARLAIIPMMQVVAYCMSPFHPSESKPHSLLRPLGALATEARGLDAGPRLFDRLISNGDTRSASMTKRIAEEEVGHVAVGVAWFLDVCNRIGVDPADRFQGLMKESDMKLIGPFNHSARSLAGLPRDWYDSSYDPSNPTKDTPDTSNLPGSTIVRGSEVQVLTKENLVQPSSERHEDGESSTGNVSSRLQEVYDRLAMVVAMEQENADA